MALQQYRIGATYYGYDPATDQGIAFSNPAEFKKYFASFNQNAPALPINPSILNASPNRLINTNPHVAASPSSIINSGSAGGSAVSNIGQQFVANNDRDIRYGIQNAGSVDVYLQRLFAAQPQWGQAVRDTISQLISQKYPDIQTATRNLPPTVFAPDKPRQLTPEQQKIIASNPIQSTPAPAQPAQPELTKAPPGVKFTDSEAYKRLTDAEKQVANTIYNVFATGTEQQAALLVDSIQKAKANADPYYKSVLDLTLGEVGSKVAQINGDYETSAKIIKKTQNDLLTNVGAQKDALTLEEQANLATLARGYDQDILRLQDEAASKGIVFASGYKSIGQMQLERTAAYSDVVESTKRKYNFSIQQLRNQADQGDKEAALQLEALTGKKTAAISNLGFNTETKVGSANTNISGYTPVGGVIGNIEEEHKKDILTGIKNYYNFNQIAL